MDIKKKTAINKGHTEFHNNRYFINLHRISVCVYVCVYVCVCFGTCYEVDIKQLCSSSFHTYSLSILSRLSDFVKSTRSINFRSVISLLLHVNASMIFLMHLIVVYFSVNLVQFLTVYFVSY